MKFKLDENLDVSLVSQFEARGHEVDTVRDEGLQGKADDIVFAACEADDRTLVTLDLDFSNPFRFPPTKSRGTIVLRVPAPSLDAIRALCKTAIDYADVENPIRAIWVVEPGRIRVWRSWDDGED